MNTYNELKKLVEKTAKTIEEYAKGNKEYVEDYNELMDGAFDCGIIKLTRHYPDLPLEYVGVRVPLYYGGPTIWADTEEMKVIGVWGTETYAQGLTHDATATIEEYVEGIF